MLNVEEKSDDKKEKQPVPESNKSEGLVCPKCGSSNIHIDKKGYSVGGGICGAILLGPLGLLCGASGANKIRKTCLNCNKEF